MAAVLACAGCSTTVPMPPAPMLPASGIGAAPDLPPYQLQVGDVLDIRLLLNPELNEEVTVRPDGMISTVVTEEVTAAGATPAGLAAELRRRYRRELREPRLTVEVRSFAPNRVYVGGEVNLPGEFVTLGPNLTVTQAIARAGGTKLGAARDRVFILRRGPRDVPQVYSVDYAGVISGADPRADVRLAPYDVVFVPRTGIYEAFTWFNQYVQQFVPVQWGFNYNVSPLVAGH